MALAKLTLIGMYEYDQTIFSTFKLPDGLEEGIAVNTILREKGEFPILYTNPVFLKFAIGTWSDENQMAFEHLAKVRKASYDPISNYDRTEEEEIDETRKSEGKGTNAASSNSGEETKRSAYNSSAYQPDEKRDYTDSSSSTTTDDRDDTMKNKRKLRAYGNIGTTTNAQMMLAEKEVVEEVNPYMIIANIFADAFCVKIY